MFLHWFRKWQRRQEPRDQRRSAVPRRRRPYPIVYRPCLEQLEERTVPSTYLWTGGSSTNWSDPANWTGGPAGTFPALAGDVAQFSGTYSSAQVVVVNSAITVGEIDFGTIENVTISASGGNTLTLDNSGTAPNAVLNVGAGTLANSGVDRIAAPLAVNAGTPLQATISGGTLDLTNISSATPNLIGSTNIFTVNTGGTLEGSADPANPALGSAGVILSGGTLQLDASASGTSTLSNAISTAAGASSALTTTAGNALTLSSPVTFTGSGTLSISNTGALTLSSLVEGGTDTLRQLGSTLTVNALTDTAAQSLTLTGAMTVPSGLTINGTLSVASGTLSISGSGTTTINGTLGLGSADGTTDGSLQFADSETLGGVGSVLFGGSLFNIVSIPAGQSLTVGPGVTVHGQSGTFGTSANNYNNSGGSIINKGIIDADDAGLPAGAAAGTLSIFTEGGLANSGTVEASNGGTLMLFRYAGQFPIGQAPIAWSSTGRLTVNDGTLDLGGIFTTADLGNFSRTGGTVNLIGNLTNNSNPGLVLNDTTGSWNLLGGEIDGGTVTTTGNNVLRAIAGGYEGQGTLNDVTLAGNLDLATGPSPRVRVINDLTLANVTASLGSADGTTSATLIFDGTQTLGGTGTLLFGGSTFNAVSIPAGQTLTVGPGITVAGQSGTFGTSANNYNNSGGSIINKGIIDADDAGLPPGATPGTLSIFTEGGLTNSGTLQANNGGTLTLFRYAGQFPIGQTPIAWSSTGTLSVTDATLNLGGIFTTADLGNFSRTGGTVNLIGNLTNDSNPGLVLDDTTGSWNLLGGEIDGGTVTTVGDNLLVALSGGYEGQGKLNDVTLAGTLDLTSTNARTQVINGLTLDNGTIPLGSADGTTIGTLTFTDTQTLGGTGRVIFGGSQFNSINIGAGETLTIAAGITIDGNSGSVGDSGGGSVSNQGTIAADSGGTLTVVDAANYSAQTSTLTGGTWEAIDAGALALLGANVVTNAANIVLDGAAAHFDSDGGGADAIARLATNAAGASFTIRNGANVTTGTFENEGNQTVGAGSTMTVNGDFTEGAPGVVNFEVGGTTPGSGFGQLNVQGTAVLFGTANVSLVNGFVPQPGQSFQVMTCTSLAGAFAAIYGVTANGLTANLSASGLLLSTATPSPDPSQSFVTITPANLILGATATVVLQARDSNGGNLMTGGSTVVFGLGSDGGSGMFGDVTDEGNGTYQATFTATTAGINTIIATIDGAPVTSTAPTVTITAADPAQSVVTVIPASITVGATTSVVLQTKDNNGSDLATGGAIVTFGLGTGAGAGTFSDVTDNGDGTYQATFTATTAGINTITATIDGTPVTSTAPTVTITTPGGVHWLNPDGGDWDTAANWLGGVVPGPNDDVVIDVPVTNPITHSQNVTDQINSLTVTAMDPIDLVSGFLQAQNIDSNGSIYLGGGGLAGATISKQTVITATQAGGILDGLTVDGFLDLGSTTGVTATVEHGLTLDGLVTIAQGSALDFPTTEMLGGTGDVYFADANALNSVSETGDGTFTIGPNVTIFGNTGKVDGGIGTLINQGTVSGDMGAGLITVTGTNWSNAGTIDADSGGAVKLTGTWTSSGTIQAFGGTASLDGTSWSNTGAITAIDSTVNLGGAFTTAGLGNFQRSGGVVNLTGTLNNTNAVLSLDSYRGSWQMAGGTILGGQVATNHFATSPTTTVHYDANQQFSTSQNPNGVWSYGWTPTLGGTFTLDTAVNQFWSGNLDVFHDPSVSFTTFQSGFGLSKGIAQITGPDGEYSVVRWTAPYAGTLYWLACYVGFNFNLSLNPDIEVLYNGQSVSKATITSEGVLTQFPLDNREITVAQGDTIDFVGRGAVWDAPGLGVYFTYSHPQSLPTALIATTQGGTLDGVTLAGSLDLTTIPGSTIQAIHGLTVNPAHVEDGVNIGTGSSLVVSGGFNQQAGTSVIDGALNADSVNLGASSYLSGAGVIQGNVTNAGHLGNATTPESLTIKGNFTQTATGVSEVALAGSAAGSGYSTINITGTATFGGALNVDVLDNLLPNKGQTFTPLTFNGDSGKFASVAGLPSNISASIGKSGVVLTSKSPTAAELAINTKYTALGGASGTLGAGTAAVLATPSGGGYYESFQNGALFYSAKKGIHVLDSADATAYAATATETTAQGVPVAKVLGLPTSNDLSTNMPGVDVVNFQGGKIYASSATGAHVLYGAMATAYAATANAKLPGGGTVQAALGLLTSDEAVFAGAPGATVLRFQNGSIYSSAATGAHVLLGPIDAAYTTAAQETDASGNSVQKILGLPTSDATGIIIIGGSPGASVAHFQGGTIYASPATGAHILYGAINTEYTATATEKGDSGSMVQTILGLPTSDIVNVTGASMMSFQGGTIYSSPASGAHAIYGAIATAYAASANETDFQGYPVQGLLGLPTTELSKVGNQFVQHFQGGAIYISPTTHVTSTLYGPLEAEYEATAQEKDANGHFVQAVLGTLLGVAGAGTNDVVAIFQGGSIYWSPDTGAHVLYGAVATEYNATVQETDANGHSVQDVLGLPMSDEAPLGVSYGLGGYSKAVPPPGARFVTFQGGTIYLSPNTGAHVLIGAIATEYAATLNEVDYFGTNILQVLGMPISDETLVPGGREVKFQGGAIYWSLDTGAHVVSGPIFTKYDSMGGPASDLGLPTSDGQPLGDPLHATGSENVFQYGKILWLPDPKIGAYAIQGTNQRSFSFNVGSSDGTPIGGSAQLTVNADGTYTFSGHLHDSGFPSYDATLTIGLVSPSGLLVPFTHIGHMAGTVESGSRDDSWSYSGTSTQLATDWVDLEGGTVYPTANASLDLGPAIDAIKTAAQDAVNAFKKNEVLATVLATGLVSPILGIAAAIDVAATDGGSYLLPR